MWQFHIPVESRDTGGIDVPSQRPNKSLESDGNQSGKPTDPHLSFNVRLGKIMKIYRVITFQAWKVALILCLLTTFFSLVAGTIALCDSMGLDYGSDPGAIAKEVSIHIMTTAGGLFVSLPSVVISTYLVKFLLRISRGVSITLSEDDSPD